MIFAAICVNHKRKCMILKNTFAKCIYHSQGFGVYEPHHNMVAIDNDTILLAKEPNSKKRVIKRDNVWAL